MMNKKSVENMYGLTAMQEGMLFHYLKDYDSGSYNELLSFSINSDIKQHTFILAWEQVVKQNEILRTVFRWDKLKHPIQIVLKEKKIDIQFHDFSKADDAIVELDNLKTLEKEKGFDLTEEAIRIIICKKAFEHYEVIIINHHIILDGWSTVIVLKEFIEAYNQIENNETVQCKDKSKYGKFIKVVNNIDSESEARFWRKHFESHEFAKVDGRQTVQEQKKAMNKFLSTELSENIKNFAKGQSFTVASIVNTLWAYIVSRYHREDDVIIGTTVSGRNVPIQGIDEIAGLFINTLPLRVDFKGATNFVEIINGVGQHMVEANKYESTSLTTIKEIMGIKEYNELFNVLVVIENYPFEKSLMNTEHIKISNFQMAEETNYDLTIGVVMGDEIEIGVSYNSGKYTESFIGRMLGHFENLVKGLVNDHQLSIDTVEMLSNEEQVQLVEQFNDTDFDYPKDITVHELFEKQVERTPSNVALVYKGMEMTYETLNEKANQVARYLRSEGVGSNTLVGLLFDRSFEMIIAILGVLKSGGAYLPIDPEYPEERIAYMIEDSKPLFLLTQEKDKDKEYAGLFEGLKVTDIRSTGILENAKGNLELASNSADLIYVIYTSGSTGKPKGAELAHSSIVSLLHWFTDRYDFTENDRHMMTNNYVFDPSVEQIFATLLSGARLYMVEKEILISPEAFNNYVEENGITIGDFVPTLMNALVKKASSENALRVLISGGEPLPVVLKNRIINMGYNLNDHYGLTEASIDNVVTRCTKDRVVLGKPIGNNKIFIKSSYGKLQPIGVPGELCISGAGLAKGYRNNEILTKEKFVSNPFVQGQRMYKTGDLAQWLEDGNIEFLGRIDNQVKVRGYRIELGEIENELQKIEAVEDAVVIVREDQTGDKYLCAYYVLEEEIEMPKIKALIAKNLPEYMVPQYFVKLDRIPLTVNDKVDRNALPEPEGDLITGTEYEAPRNEVEEQLAGIFKTVLGIKGEVGIQDNFFELGGHSLKATTLVAQIRKVMDVDMPLMEVFKSPTVKGLGEIIGGAEKSIYDEINPVENR